MRFTDPFVLLLFVPLVAGLFFSFRRVHGMAKARKRLAFAIRFVLAGLLVLALAGIQSRVPNRGTATVFLMDVSDSVPEHDRKAAQKFVDEAMQKLGPNDLASVVVFGADPALDASMAGRRGLGPIQSRVNGAGTDLAAAVRLASATLPDGKAKRIVLLSDGNETRGDAAGAAAVAQADGIVIDTVTLPGREKTDEAAMVSLEAPDEARQGQPFDLRATVESTVAQTVSIDLDRDGVLLRRIPVKLAAGTNRIVLPEKSVGTGLHRYRATLMPRVDGDNRNNVGLAFTAVKGQPKILLAQSHPERGELAAALRRRGWLVDVVPDGGFPSHPEELAAYDAVILNDYNASGLMPKQMATLANATREAGVGLAMVGGEDSFLPGGWYGTPVAEALPVDLNIRQRKSFPSTSVAIMIDASGSMGMMEDGFPKIRLAAKAAEETVKLLSPMDRVAVAGSSDGIEFVVPMQKLTNKDAVANQLRRLDINGGGIYIRPTVDKAEQVLNAETSKVRHHILLADGNDSEDQEGALGVTLRMHQNKITTSVVAIGDGKDVQFLRQLAAAGGGRFYLAKHAGQLKAIFTQDTAVMSRSAIEEGAFLPKVVPGEEILRGIDSTPPLLAYCLTDRRPLARTTMLTKKDDPLLAVWQYGLGTSLAFTSDATARWAKQWVGWPGYDAFWSQAARAIARRATRNVYQASVHQDAGKGMVELTATDTLGNPITTNRATVHVALPDGTGREVTMEQEAPGKFVGNFDADKIGSYLVTVAEPDPKGGVRTRTTGFSLPYPAEYRTVRPNRPLLSHISQVTGGMALTRFQDVLRPIRNSGASITELWPWLLLAAGLLLPLDIAVRRIALPWAEIFAKVRLRVARRPVPVPVETVGRLQQAKARARVTTETAEAPVPMATTAPRPEPRKAPARATGGERSPAASLLEAKRRRQGD